MTIRNFADEIIVTAGLTPATFSLTIDGVEFPWHIDRDGISLQVAQDDTPGITIRILANRVRIDHGTTPKADTHE